MSKPVKRLLWLGLCCLVWLGALPARAADVRLAFGQSLAPFADERTGQGIEIEILRAALRAAGHRLVPVFLPQARVPLALQDAQLDGAATLTADSGVQAAYSDVYIHYDDVVITHRGRLQPPVTLASLAGLRVVGFQNAARYLGPDFAAMVRDNPRYVEQANQLTQVRMLFGGQADALVIEARIYAWQVAQLRQSRFREMPVPVDSFALFERIPYRVAFRDPALRDAFNAGLSQARAQGEVARIEAAYQLPSGGR